VLRYKNKYYIIIIADLFYKLSAIFLILFVILRVFFDSIHFSDLASTETESKISFKSRNVVIDIKANESVKKQIKMTEFYFRDVYGIIFLSGELISEEFGIVSTFITIFCQIIKILNHKTRYLRQFDVDKYFMIR